MAIVYKARITYFFRIFNYYDYSSVNLYKFGSFFPAQPPGLGLRDACVKGGRFDGNHPLVRGTDPKDNNLVPGEASR
jgi:hypothetical protein